MGLIKEPFEVDFSGQSIPWTEEELFDFKKLMKKIKEKNKRKKEKHIKINFITTK